MKITLTKPHALNGKILPAGTHEVADATAKKLIEKKHAKPVEAKAPAKTSAPAAN